MLPKDAAEPSLSAETTTGDENNGPYGRELKSHLFHTTLASL